MSAVRTAPFWSGRCFCGHVSPFFGPIAGVYEAGDVLRLPCWACGALLIFRAEFRHVETVRFFAFRQLDHDPTVPIAGRYR